MLFAVIVFAGSLFIVNFNIQKHSPVIPNVDAQVTNTDFLSSVGGFGMGGMAPQNILFSRNPFPGTQLEGVSFPGDVMFVGDILFDGSRDKTEMRTIMTCSGCSQTMATCDWNCGPTFSFCNTGEINSGSTTMLTCSSGSYGGCGVVSSNTLMTCGSNLFGGCGTGGNTQITCGGTLFGRCGGGGNTFITCGNSMFGACGGSGSTFLTCSNISSRCYQPKPKYDEIHVLPIYAIYGPDLTIYEPLKPTLYNPGPTFLTCTNCTFPVGGNFSFTPSPPY